MNALADLLNAVALFVRRFVVLRTDAQAIVIALYVVHTHAIEAADATPYLAVTSAEKRSGKTRVLEVLELLVRNPALVAHISEAALYRTIAQERPTLLFDEVDSVFGKAAKDQNEGLRGILNAGHRRGATVRRCVGDGKKMRVEKFDVYCAKVLAGLGKLPDTVSDRAIHIRLQRRTPGETVERFRPRRVEPEAADLRTALSEWVGAAQVLEYLKNADPALPGALDDRAQDAWEPLLCLADLAGAEWPEAARVAAVELAQVEVDDDSLGVLILEHVRDAFNGHNHLATDELLRALIERDDAPWAEWWGRDVSDDRIKGPAARLSRLLRPFEIKPKVFRDGAVTARGYVRDHLEPVWDRYLPPHPPENTEHVTAQVATTRDVTSFEFSEGEGEAGEEHSAPVPTLEEQAAAIAQWNAAHPTGEDRS
jgi:hypothetical protein